MGKYIVNVTMIFTYQLIAVLLIPLLVVYYITPVATNYWLWEWANALGYLAISSSALLFIYTSKPASYPKFSGQFFVHLHRDLGFITVILVTLHIVLLLIKEPLLIEHLTFVAPGYMLAGLVASVLILLLSFTALRSVRNKVWGNYARFKQCHLYLSLAFIVLSAWHIITSLFYLNHAIKIILIGSLVLLTGVYFVKKRTSLKSYRGSTTKKINPRHAVLNNYASLLFVVMFALVISLLIQV